MLNHTEASPTGRRSPIRATSASSAFLMLAMILLVGCGVHSAPVIIATATPEHHEILPSELPAPFATPSANNGPHVIPPPDGATLYTPPGFKVAEWASGLDNPRFLTVAPNGDIFVAESAAGRVTVLRASNDPAKPDVREHFVTDLHQPFGIAFYPPGKSPKYVYIADTDEVIRFPYANGDLTATGPGEKMVDLTPGGYNQHWTRTILFTRDGKKMLVAVGSKSNIGIEDPPRASVMEFNPDGTGGRVYATGLRNAVGLTWNPVTGKLWAAVNERDGLGDRVPPDYATSVVDGGFYGWPYYYIGTNHDPRMPENAALRDRVLVPDVLLEPHCAALSIEFDTGKMFPFEYRNDAFLVMHGSWNRSDRAGYKVVRIPMNRDGTPKGGYEDFVWGWKMPDEDVWGRPVACVFAKDGSLLITDDGENKIWRVSVDK